jgi:hypothetical protein
VVYAHIASGATVFLFTAYGKNEQSDLTADETKVFRQVLQRLHTRYKS